MTGPFQFDPRASFTGMERGFCMVCGHVLPEGKFMGICEGEHPMTDTERAAYARGYRAGQVAMRERAAGVAADVGDGHTASWRHATATTAAAIRALMVEDGNGG